MWLEPLEPMSADAIALMCDADRRPRDAGETLIVRISPLP
jgi:hypothetical protein